MGLFGQTGIYPNLLLSQPGYSESFGRAIGEGIWRVIVTLMFVNRRLVFPSQHPNLQSVAVDSRARRHKSWRCPDII
jgi:hypothetical protein